MTPQPPKISLQAILEGRTLRPPLHPISKHRGTAVRVWDQAARKVYMVWVAP